MLLNGETIGDVDESGEPIKDDSFLILLNCHHEPIKFFVPAPPGVEKWCITIDTNNPNMALNSHFCDAGCPIDVAPLSLVLCQEPKAPSVSRLLGAERQ
jgi:glycogen operon protein